MSVEDPLGQILAEVEHEWLRRVEAVEGDSHRPPLLRVEREPVKAMPDREELLDEPELAIGFERSGVDSRGPRLGDSCSCRLSSLRCFLRRC
jgi:hypothetical protein